MTKHYIILERTPYSLRWQRASHVTFSNKDEAIQTYLDNTTTRGGFIRKLIVTDGTAKNLKNEIDSLNS